MFNDVPVFYIYVSWEKLWEILRTEKTSKNKNRFCMPVRRFVLYGSDCESSNDAAIRVIRLHYILQNITVVQSVCIVQQRNASITFVFVKSYNFTAEYTSTYVFFCARGNSCCSRRSNNLPSGNDNMKNNMKIK